MAEASTPAYDPDPRGLASAREAVAASYAARGLAVDADRIVLTASTSEAYGWLFKLLCDPGERVLVPRPSYPLFEYLATLESIPVTSYPLRYDGRWEIDRDDLLGALSAATPGSRDRWPGSGSGSTEPGPPRAIVLVN